MKGRVRFLSSKYGHNSMYAHESLIMKPKMALKFGVVRGRGSTSTGHIMDLL